MQILTGSTPDISAILQFDFYEPVYYKTEESHFPSMSNEKSGHFVGISEHVGHALTFMILTDDTQKIIHRSIVRTATDPTTKNLRAERPLDHEPEEYIQSHIDDPVNENDGSRPRMSIVNPEDLIGHTFGVTQDDGQLNQIRIVEAIRDHQSHVDDSSTNVRFWCSINGDAYEDILSYNQVLDYLSQEEDDGVIWKFKDIIGSQRTPQESTPRL